jgi:hypothetical protein
VLLCLSSLVFTNYGHGREPYVCWASSSICLLHTHHESTLAYIRHQVVKSTSLFRLIEYVSALSMRTPANLHDCVDYRHRTTWIDKLAVTETTKTLANAANEGFNLSPPGTCPDAVRPDVFLDTSDSLAFESFPIPFIVESQAHTSSCHTPIRRRGMLGTGRNRAHVARSCLNAAGALVWAQTLLLRVKLGYACSRRI